MTMLTPSGRFAVCAACTLVLTFAPTRIGWSRNPEKDGYHVYVTNEHSGDLTVIDGTEFKVSAEIPVGKRPRGIHVSPDGKTIYIVSNTAGIIIPITAVTGKAGKPIKIGTKPDAIAITP